jgi:hypothetical protein
VAAGRGQELAGGAAGRAWARSELRRRWRALLVLGLLAGLTCGIATAAVAGARRSDAAWDRLRQASLASDAIVFASQAGIDDPDWSRIERLPFVAASGAFSFGLVDNALIVNQHGDLFTEVDRPRILDGRLPDPRAPLEVVAEARSASTDPEVPAFHVGQRIPVHLMTEDQEEAGPEADLSGAPTVELHVVGIARSPFTMVAIPATSGNLFAGPAFRKAYPDQVATFSNLFVRLRDADRDLPKLEAAVAEEFPGAGVPVADLRAAAKRVTNGTGLETTGLLLFALAVAAAGIVIVGQALTRSVRAASGDLPTLSAMGFDRTGATGALALPHLVSVGAAVVTAAATAVALSPRFPIGLARQVDPDVGRHVDAPVLVGGLAAVALLLAGAVLVTAWRASRRGASISADRSSALVALARRAGAPVPLVTGASLALEPGRGHRALPTRSAVTGAMAGVLGLVSALVFLRGLDDAASHPERFGTTWQLEATFYGPEPGEGWADLPHLLEGDPDVVGVARLGRVPAPIDGLVVPIYSVAHAGGRPIDYATIDGRRPRGRGEILLGPDTADRLHVGIGDRVTVGDGQRFRVVGLGLLPTTPHSSFDQGGWVTLDDLPRAIPRSVRETLTEAYGTDLRDDAALAQSVGVLGNVAVALRPGADVTEVEQRLRDEISPEIVLSAPTPSADQQAMHNVRSLPILFGVFAPLVALAALLHVSSSVLRRRGTDIAVLRAIGLTPRQAAACVAWQSTVLAAIGLVVGAPLGFIAGRTAWRVVAEHTPIVTVIPSLSVALLVIVPAALLAANLAGARPAWRVARSSPVEQLRAD